jgi:hypothetical protein
MPWARLLQDSDPRDGPAAAARPMCCKYDSRDFALRLTIRSVTFFSVEFINGYSFVIQGAHTTVSGLRA